MFFQRVDGTPAGRLVTAAVIVLGAGALLALPGCRQPEVPETTESARNVRVLQLAPETLAEFFEITGPVAPVRGTDISAQESGPVTALLLAKGEPVGRGQAILELEREILRAEMEAAEAALETQAYNLDKVQQLFDAGKVSRIELLTARTQHQTARAQADISRERFDRAQIKAPFAGLVADRYVELGQMVLPGQKVARVIDPYTLKLEGYLTSDQVGWARLGVLADLVLGDNGQKAQGKVTWVAMEADVRTGKFKVEIEIPNLDLHLRSGVIGRARMPKNTSIDVVTIPRDAVMKGRHGPEVFVIRDDRAHRASVTLGPYQGAMVVVTQGLQAGDQLVVRGHRDLVDGSLVKITERATAANGSLDSDPGIISGTGLGAGQ
jgi:membrane fusion protein (multidrug efflux system)